MKDSELESWLTDALPKHSMLTSSVVNIVQSLLDAENIDYLAVSGRTKTAASIKEKIKSKSYQNPKLQMTDVSGIRIIVYFESDVDKVAQLIETAFSVDAQNSLSKDAMLATDQIGYRSIHYVCDLGEDRLLLPEFSNFKDLKFEFQIRTVLQHAWAELAHDRNYKFTGKLPKNIERKLYLYAGMLEIADKGFDELSKDIEAYIEEFKERTSEGDYDIELNSLSLDEFIDEWAASNSFPLENLPPKSEVSDLVNELEEFGIKTISELRELIPENYASKAIKKDYSTTIFGLVRDWMLISDYKKYHENVNYTWEGLGSVEGEMFSEYLSPTETSEVFSIFDQVDTTEIIEWEDFLND